MTWIEPKTNWSVNDRFNIGDFNRIKNNLNYLRDKVVQLIRPLDISDMGADMTSYSEYWNVDIFNLFETNLEKIAKNSYGENYGESLRFFENGGFIKYDELNRIESATLDIYNMLVNQEAGMRRMPFVLGRFKEVRI